MLATTLLVRRHEPDRLDRIIRVRVSPPCDDARPHHLGTHELRDQQLDPRDEFVFRRELRPECPLEPHPVFIAKPARRTPGDGEHVVLDRDLDRHEPTRLTPAFGLEPQLSQLARLAHGVPDHPTPRVRERQQPLAREARDAGPLDRLEVDRSLGGHELAHDRVAHLPLVERVELDGLAVQHLDLARVELQPEPIFQEMPLRVGERPRQGLGPDLVGQLVPEHDGLALLLPEPR